MSILSVDLKFVLVFTILAVITIFILSSWHNDKIYKRDRQEKLDTQNIRPPQKQVTKSDEIIDTLDWMLARGIITPQEYTKLVGKCLPFLQ